jgi:hypothetical protein
LRLAYTRTSGGVQSVWSYSADTKSTVELAAFADPAAATATVERLAWLPDALHPTVTWSAHDAGTTTGLFSQSILSSAPAQRLTPAVMRFGAADFSAARDGGVWLVARTSPSPALATVSAQTGAMSVEGTGTAVSAVGWSPDGGMAFDVTLSGQLELWTPGTSAVSALSGVTGTPVWSADGSQLAAQANGRIVSVRLSGARPASLARLVPMSDPAALAWAPDGGELAVAGPSGVTLVSADGAHAKPVDAHPADGGVVAWSIAR